MRKILVCALTALGFGSLSNAAGDAAAGLAQTGGLGTGAGLGNHGAPALAESNRWQLVLNAGGGSISGCRIASGGRMTLLHPDGVSGGRLVPAGCLALPSTANGIAAN